MDRNTSFFSTEISIEPQVVDRKLFSADFKPGCQSKCLISVDQCSHIK